jgi:late competence protein required for DNA uptake (superfamily II DNA/RNA helicase)
MQAEELPQEYIDALAELLLELSSDELPTYCTRCSRSDVTHNYNEQPYCERCRNCYPDTPAD